MPDFGIMRGFNDKLFGDKLYAGQLPTQLGLIGSFKAYDADAQAFFDRVTTAGGSLSETEKLAINTLVIQIKLDGIWTKMKAIYPMVGASAAACAQNLKSASFTGTFTAGWTFASTGVKGNGSSSYMDTTLLPSTELLLNSTHLSFYSRTDTPSGSIADLGSIGSSLSYTLIEIFGNVLYNLINQSTIASVAMTTTLGHFISSRRGATDSEAYRNGASVATFATSSNALSDRALFLGAFNGPTIQFYSNREYAFASIGDGLTDTQASNLYTAVQAFQTTLSRQV
jgi:hypothetical protein